MILPKDGIISYTPNFLPSSEAEHLMISLTNNIQWKKESIRIFGKEVSQPRLTAWYGDPGAVYTYSGLTMPPLPWIDELSRIRELIRKKSGAQFNSVLMNYYKDGSDYMGWHTDNEKELGPNPTIASLSLGGVRKFQLKHRQDKSLKTIQLELESGSLLIMSGIMQAHWLHKIAATKKKVEPRINMTFRKIII